jgi:hypothetical protein
MKIVVWLLVFCIVVTLFYGFNQNQAMHNDLVRRLNTDGVITTVTGKVISFEYVYDGSDCKYGGSCEENLWKFRVNGERKCIYVDIVTYESFPFYHVVSIAPEVGLASSYLDEKVIYENKPEIIECVPKRDGVTTF